MRRRSVIVGVVTGVVAAFWITLNLNPSVRVVAQAVDSCDAAAIGTFGAALGCVDQITKGLRQSAKELIEQGNNALAQQQLLLAGTLEALTKNIRESLKDVLNTAFKDLDGTRQNTFTDLMALVDNAKKGADKAGAVVEDIHSRTNQLLDRLPLLKHEPALFGVVVKDLADREMVSRADIEVRGYRLADPALNYRKPVVRLLGDGLPPDGEVVEDRYVAAFYGGVNVEVPPKIKEALNFVNRPCAPRHRIKVSLDVPYKADESWMYVMSRKVDRTARLEDFGQPGVDAFEVFAIYEGERTTKACTVESYSRTQGQVNVGCEDGASSLVGFDAPDGARELGAQCAWVDTDKLKNVSCNAAASGLKATATGSVSGVDKEGWGIKNCPGGGHGALRVYGTYKIDTANVGAVSSAQLRSVLRQDHVEFVEPADVGFSAAVVAEVARTVEEQRSPKIEPAGPVVQTQEIRLPFGLLGPSISVPVVVVKQSSMPQQVREVLASFGSLGGILAGAASGSAMQSATNGVPCDGTKPVNTTVWKQVRLEIHRLGCPLVYDSVTLPIAMSGAVQQSGSQTSQQGRFRVTVRGANLRVEKIQS